jgi:arylsulfatase A-like enzyme
MDLRHALLLTCGTLAAVPAAGAAKKPNILYIFTDQQTAGAMGCTGNGDLRTPAMDRLAALGVRYTNAYCAAPLSTPSRYAMFTGVTPGATGNLTNGSSRPERSRGKTLGELVEAAGYRTGYGGKWHLPQSSLPDDSRYGFAPLHPHDDKGLAGACAEFIRERSDKPFFLVAAFDNPHNICQYARGQNLPFRNIDEPASVTDCPGLPANFAVQPYDARVIRYEQSRNFSLYPVAGYGADDWRRYRNAYYRMVEYVDAEIGEILDALLRSGQWDDTVIIFTSDHGDGNGAHGWNQKSALYEEVVNVPLIVKEAGGGNAGTLNTAIVNNGVDLLPTVCRIAGADVPDYCGGVAMAFAGGTEEREYTVCETMFDGSDTRGWMVRTPRYKYVVYDKGLYREQLFDMSLDRGEMVNLAVDGRYSGVLERCREHLREWAARNGVKIPVL